MLLILLILVIILFSKIIINKNMIKENMITKELKFIHIPKNAGTSIEELGKKYNLKWGKYDYSNLDLKENLSLLPCCYWHNYLFKISDKNDYFCVVRNPYDRIKSEYYYRKKKNYIFELNLNDWINKFLKNISNVNVNVNVYDCHLIPQYNYIFDKEGNKKIKHILYLDEKLSKNLKEILNEYDINIDVNHFEKRNESKSHMETFSRNSIELINEYYKKDFEYLDYEML
jgi:hypothetical protein